MLHKCFLDLDEGSILRLTYYYIKSHADDNFALFLNDAKNNSTFSFLFARTDAMALLC